MAFFAVTMVNGPGYDDDRPRREQDGWDQHAAFMDQLVAAGFVHLGGPVGDGSQTLLAIEAADAAEIEARFSEDPWAATGVLRVDTIQPWTIWLDGRSPPARP
jgi:uncharacterized protein